MILITGGTGLLGSYLLYELVKQLKQVRVLIRNRDKIQVVLNLFNCFDSFTSQSYKLIDWTSGYIDVRDVAKAMILEIESDISGERFILNSENLRQ